MSIGVFGNTPLIVASKLGNYTNVKILLDADPDSVNLPMPNCGNNALYVAVAAACIDAEHSTNKSKTADHFLKTVEVLVKHGADPSMENNSGNSVNLLLNEFRLSDMSMIIANAIVACKYPKVEKEAVKDISAIMLVKEDTGAVNLQELKNERRSEKTRELKKFIINPTVVTKCIPVSSGGVLKKIVGPKNNSAQDIIIYAGKSINKAPKSTQAGSVMYAPIAGKVEVKNTISIDGQNVKSCAQTNIAKTAAKVVTGAKITSTITMPSCNVTTVKRIFKKKAPQERDQTRDVPIKKQKRDLNPT